MARLAVAVGGAMNSLIARNLPAAKGLSERPQSFDLEEFAARYGGVTVVTFKPGELLFSQGDAAECVYYLQAGQIRMTVVSKQGKQGILRIIQPGNFCGEGCLLQRNVRMSTAVCLAEVLAARLERSNVITAIRDDPVIAEFFLLLALKRVLQFQRSMISLLFDDSEQRLARVLLELADANGVGAGTRSIIRHFDQETLAQIIGTTRSRVNYFMNKFRRLGYIDYGDGIVVHASLRHAMLRNAFAAARHADDPTAR